MQRIKHLRDMLCDELCEYGEKDSLTAQDVDMIDKFAHAAKNLDKIIAGPEGYSMDGHSGRRMYYDRAYDGRSYDDGPEGSSGDYSRRGRGPGAKRDSMGRYSSRSYSGAAMDEY